MKKNILLLILPLLLFGLLDIAEGSQIPLSRIGTPQLIIYHSGLVLIQEQVAAKIPYGESTLILEGFSPEGLPPSVFFRQLTGPNELAIKSQNYKYTPLTYYNLVREMVGEEITFLFEDGREAKGELLTLRPDLLIQFEDQLAVNPKGKILLRSVPEGMAIQPTMEWVVESLKEDRYQFLLHYLARGLDWVADYVGILNQEDLSLQGWITLRNTSQGDFLGSKVLVVAGDVQVESVRKAQPYMEMMVLSDEVYTSRRGVGEFYVYRIEGEVDLLRDTVKQVAFLSTQASVDHIFLFPTYMQGGNLLNTLVLNNQEERGLGIPLPRGIMRIYQEDDGEFFFLGEDAMGHLGVLDEGRLILGGAFDIRGQRRLIERKQIKRDEYWEKIEILILNARNKEAKVVVEGELGWGWTIGESSHDFEIYDVNKILFHLTIPPGEEELIEYTKISH